MGGMISRHDDTLLLLVQGFTRLVWHSFLSELKKGSIAYN